MESFENSVHANTPWMNDEEIYDYVINKRQEEEWEWDSIKMDLTLKGLPEYYADSIIANLQEASNLAKGKVRKRGVVLIIGALVLLGFGIYHGFISTTTTLTVKGAFVFLLGGFATLIYGIKDLTRKF